MRYPYPPVTTAPARAFTLIELLVCVSIIALMIAMLIPALSRAREQARKTVCLSNLRQIGTCVQMYGETNEGWGMGGYRGNADLIKYDSTTGPVYLGTLITEDQTSTVMSTSSELPQKMLYCPSSQYAPAWDVNTWANTTTSEKNWINNAATVCSYVTNPNLSSYSKGTGSDAYALTRGKLLALSPSLAVVSDHFLYTSTNAKYGTCPRNHGDNYFNFMRVDGSADVFLDTKLVIKTAVDTGVNSGNTFKLISQ